MAENKKFAHLVKKGNRQRRKICIVQSLDYQGITYFESSIILVCAHLWEWNVKHLVKTALSYGKSARSTKVSGAPSLTPFLHPPRRQSRGDTPAIRRKCRLKEESV